jgi:hypothetical protein
MAFEWRPDYVSRWYYARVKAVDDCLVLMEGGETSTHHISYWRALVRDGLIRKVNEPIGTIGGGK